MLPVEVCQTFVKAFKSNINLKQLRPGQQLEFKLQGRLKVNLRVSDELHTPDA